MRVTHIDIVFCNELYYRMYLYGHMSSYLIISFCLFLFFYYVAIYYRQQPSNLFREVMFVIEKKLILLQKEAKGLF
jgi:hypothetical protein